MSWNILSTNSFIFNSHGVQFCILADTLPIGGYMIQLLREDPQRGWSSAGCVQAYFSNNWDDGIKSMGFLAWFTSVLAAINAAIDAFFATVPVVSTDPTSWAELQAFIVTRLKAVDVGTSCVVSIK